MSGGSQRLWLKELKIPTEKSISWNTRAAALLSEMRDWFHQKLTGAWQEVDTWSSSLQGSDNTTQVSIDSHCRLCLAAICCYIWTLPEQTTQHVQTHATQCAGSVTALWQFESFTIKLIPSGTSQRRLLIHTREQSNRICCKSGWICILLWQHWKRRGLKTNLVTSLTRLQVTQCTCDSVCGMRPACRLCRSNRRGCDILEANILKSSNTLHDPLSKS